MYVDVFEVNKGNLLLLLGYGVNLVIWMVALAGITSSNQQKSIACILGIATASALITVPTTILAPVLLIFWMSYLADSMAEKKLWLSYILINFSVMMLAVWFGANAQAIITMFSFIAFQLFAISSTLQAKELSKQRDTIEKTNLELITTQSLLLQTSKLEERQRILQNLHDGIGHQLTAMSLQNEHTLQLMKLNKTVNVAAYLDQQKCAIKETLLALRHIVKQSRNAAYIDLETAMIAIADKLPSVALNYASQIHFERPVLIEDLIYSFQEGISNAVRHGGADAIDIDILKDNANVSITLIDNGNAKQSSNSTDSVFGSGLSGMQERLSLYDAQVDLVKNKGNGFTLMINMPLAQCVINQAEIPTKEIS